MAKHCMEDRARHLVLGFVGGIAAAAALPFVSPVIAAVVRPAAKAMLTQSMLAFDRLRTIAARAAESVEDLFAEVRVEVDAELLARDAAESARDGKSAEAPHDPGRASAPEPQATRVAPSQRGAVS